KWLAEETKNAITSANVAFSNEWGLDHGCWSVTRNMFPQADIPIIQLSLDYTQPAIYHYNLAKQLQNLRSKGVLIIGSGNMVHNFQHIQVKGNDFNAPFGHDWALEANATFKKLILANDFNALSNYKNYSKATALAAPTPEHYLPMLYSLAMRNATDEI